MKLSTALFLKSIRLGAAEYPEIEYKEMIVDNAHADCHESAAV